MARKSEDAEKESKGVGLWQTQEQTDTYDGQKSIQIWQPLYISGAVQDLDLILWLDLDKADREVHGLT